MNQTPKERKPQSSQAGAASTSSVGSSRTSRSGLISSKEDTGDDQPSSDRRKKDESKEAKPQLSAKTALSAPVPDYDPLEVIPEEYRKHGVDTEPMLYYIRQKTEEEELDDLLEAAQRDVRLHQARIRAALLNNPALLASYDFTQDPAYVARQERKKERIAVVENLSKEAKIILKELDEEKKNLTPAERTQVKLARWQRALELYVYCPSEMSLDLLGLLEKLLNGTSEVSGTRLISVLNNAVILSRYSSNQCFVHRSRNSRKSFPRLQPCAPRW